MNEFREPDIVDVFARVHRFFTKHKAIILTITLIGFLAGVGKFCFSGRFYETYFVVSTGKIEAGLISKVFYSLPEAVKQLIDEPDEEVVGSIERNIEKIRHLTIEPLYKGTIIIKVELSDNQSDLTQLQSSIVQLIRFNSYVSEIILSEKEYLISQLAKLNEEIEEIDTLQKRILEKYNSVEKVFLTTEFFRIFGYNIIDMSNKKLELERKIEEIDNFTIIQSISLPEFSFKNLIIDIVFHLALFFVFSVIVSAYIDVLRTFKRRKYYEKDL